MDKRLKPGKGDLALRIYHRLFAIKRRKSCFFRNNLTLFGQYCTQTVFKRGVRNDVFA